MLNPRLLLLHTFPPCHFHRFFLIPPQSRTEDKIERFKKAVEYYSVAMKAPPTPAGQSPYVREYPGDAGQLHLSLKRVFSRWPRR